MDDTFSFYIAWAYDTTDPYGPESGFRPNR